MFYLFSLEQNPGLPESGFSRTQRYKSASFIRIKTFV